MKLIIQTILMDDLLVFLFSGDREGLFYPDMNHGIFHRNIGADIIFY